MNFATNDARRSLTMKHLILLGLLLLTLGGLTAAQTPGSKTDKCHVYVVDVLMSLKYQKEVENVVNEAEIQKIAAKYKSIETTFPFEATVAEETQTTRHFALPDTKLFVTASVYYTDEIMAAGTARDSITLGIFISPNKPESAIGLENLGNAVAETLYRSPGKFRVKQYVTANSKKYLVGLECESK